MTAQDIQTRLRSLGNPKDAVFLARFFKTGPGQYGEGIVGTFLADRSRRPLYRLARSARLWDRRISILATFHFIRLADFADTLKIAEMLLGDREDLMHKAVGWMLR